MRSLLFMLMFAPLVSVAQDGKTDEKKSDGQLVLVHADNTTKRAATPKKDEKKKLKDDIVYKGNVQFTVGGNTITCDSAVSYENENSVAAYNIKLTHEGTFTITGGVLRFNRETANASLTDNISVTALNGNLVGNSEDFALDFNYERYHIANGIIIPPKEKDKQ